MAKKGGQPGNQNAAKAKRWAAAIDRALEARYEKNTSLKSAQEALDQLAEKLLAAAENGDLGAIKELGDRIDGKPAQAVEMLVEAKTISGDVLTDDAWEQQYGRDLEASSGPAEKSH